MVAYELVEQIAGAGTFIDSDQEQNALAVAREAYAETPVSSFVIYESKNDYTSDPTHVLLGGVLYKLVPIEFMTNP